MKTINASIGNTPYRTKVSTDKHVFYVDEPVEVGGEDTAASPFELMIGSLASCTLITMRMYADRKEWGIKEIRINIDYDKDSKEVNRIIELIDASADVNKDRMLLIANKCPIHKLLEPVLNIQTKIL